MLEKGVTGVKKIKKYLCLWKSSKSQHLSEPDSHDFACLPNKTYFSVACPFCKLAIQVFRHYICLQKLSVNFLTR